MSLALIVADKNAKANLVLISMSATTMSWILPPRLQKRLVEVLTPSTSECDYLPLHSLQMWLGTLREDDTEEGTPKLV